MQPEQSLAIMKALADGSRLAIINSLLDHPQYVEEIAKRHALAPSTVSFHLKKLEQAGLIQSRKEQYYVVVSANEPLFDTTLRQIVTAATAPKALQDERIVAYRRKVLESFFCHGRLEKLPAQHKKRLIVLEQFAARFEPGQHYPEPEANGLIKPLFDDYCTIRRLLVDEGMLMRDGATYWREASAESQTTTPLPSDRPLRKKSEGRAEQKRLYKEQHNPDMGVYQVRNRVNGRIYVESSTNLEGTRTSRLFQLRMGKIVFNPELQKDLQEFGAESFEFSVLEVLPAPKPGENVKQLLKELKLRWQEKLHPFGDKGYNSLKGYERERG